MRHTLSLFFQISSGIRLVRKGQRISIGLELLKGEMQGERNLSQPIPILHIPSTEIYQLNTLLYLIDLFSAH